MSRGRSSRSPGSSGWRTKRIPASFDYAGIPHLRTEAREKLSRIRPVNLAQASRISGITPADLALVLAHWSGKGVRNRFDVT